MQKKKKDKSPQETMIKDASIQDSTKPTTTETPEFTSLYEEIKKFSPSVMPKKEKELELMLVNYLRARYPNIISQQYYGSTKIDAQIGKIGIEIKYQPSASDFQRLFGQIDVYSRYLDKIIVVIGYEKSKQDTGSFQRSLDERGWLNSKVFIVTVK
jgi:hypothetical protein